MRDPKIVQRSPDEKEKKVFRNEEIAFSIMKMRSIIFPLLTEFTDVQVSWIRRKDWHILTVGRKEFTTDQR